MKDEIISVPRYYRRKGSSLTYPNSWLKMASTRLEHVAIGRYRPVILVLAIVVLLLELAIDTDRSFVEEK